MRSCRILSADRIFWGILAVCLLAAPVLSFDYGSTVDEMLAHIYGERIYNFYASGFTVQEFMDLSGLHLYGGLFELLGVLAVKAVQALRLTTHFQDLYEIRHVVNSFFGWGMLLFTGLLARRLYGAWAGVLALVLLLLTPRFLGHAFNNPKDVPFAAVFVAVLYGLSHIRKCRPYFSLRAAVFITVGTGAAMAIRIGGLLLIFYAGLLLALVVYREKEPVGRNHAAKTAALFILCAMASLVVNALFSPWQLANPLVRPFLALKVMNHFTAYPDSVVFAGQVWDHLHLTRWFLPVWLAISTPIALMAGFALSLFFAWRSADRDFTGLLLLSVVFPVVYVLLRNPPLYHDMRHFFFIIPSAVVLAAGGYVNAAAWLKRSMPGRDTAVGAVCLLALCALLYDPLRFIVRNHPNEAVYFNQFVGGYKGAFFNYELDYWMNARKQAEDWIRKVTAINGKSEGDYELINLNKWPDDKRKALRDPSVVNAIFIGDYPVMMIRLKSK